MKGTNRNKGLRWQDGTKHLEMEESLALGPEFGIQIKQQVLLRNVPRTTLN